MEARSLSPALSNQLLSKVREYKADLAKLQQEVSPQAGSGWRAKSQCPVQHLLLCLLQVMVCCDLELVRNVPALHRESRGQGKWGCCPSPLSVSHSSSRAICKKRCNKVVVMAGEGSQHRGFRRPGSQGGAGSGGRLLRHQQRAAGAHAAVDREAGPHGGPNHAGQAAAPGNGGQLCTQDGLFIITSHQGWGLRISMVCWRCATARWPEQQGGLKWRAYLSWASVLENYTLEAGVHRSPRCP